MLKGYRTVILTIAMSLGSVTAVQYSQMPPETQHFLTLLSAAWGFVGIFLRLVTSTPIGQKVEAAVEKDLGVSQAQMDKFLALLPKTASLVDAAAQAEKVVGAVSTMQTDAANAAQKALSA